MSIGIKGEVTPEFAEILTPDAMAFLEKLHAKFNTMRRYMLDLRKQKQTHIDAGHLPQFLQSTKSITKDNWTVADIPSDLQDRRVEITGPTDRKMIINALNSGAKVFMADLEDSNSPTWNNMVNGQINLRDAVNKTISFTNAKGKHYSLNDDISTLMVRPRGWHLEEKHVFVGDQPMSGSIFDFGLYFYHNAKTLLDNGSGPYFYLAKLESHLEAKLWNDIFEFSQKELGIPNGSIRATVLIETLTAAFEADEILYVLRDHSAGLNCGRWDYIFSFIKRMQKYSSFTLPDRSEVNMSVPFMEAYCKHVVQTCHKRGIHAMGGMAAQIPIKNDPEANEASLQKVRQDKLREVKLGHDGTWVAHPGLIPIAMDIFNEHMPQPHQISMQVDYNITSDDLLEQFNGDITEGGFRTNISVGMQYLDAWLKGNGCVPLYNLMEDAATAEISRTQIWQWIKHSACLQDGRKITEELLFHTMLEETAKNPVSATAAMLFYKISTQDTLEEFLTIGAYNFLENNL